jgi:hypothetical protein
MDLREQLTALLLADALHENAVGATTFLSVMNAEVRVAQRRLSHAQYATWQQRVST